jgi:hypothetical protein
VPSFLAVLTSDPGSQIAQLSAVNGPGHYSPNPAAWTSWDEFLQCELLNVAGIASRTGGGTAVATEAAFPDIRQF